MANGANIFSEIFDLDIPNVVRSNRDGRNRAFRIRFSTDGTIPYVRVVIHAPGGDYVVSGGDIAARPLGENAVSYVASIPRGALEAGAIQVEIAACKIAEPENADSDDWVTVFRDLRVLSSTQNDLAVEPSNDLDQSPPAGQAIEDSEAAALPLAAVSTPSDQEQRPEALGRETAEVEESNPVIASPTGTVDQIEGAMMTTTDTSEQAVMNQPPEETRATEDRTPRIGQAGLVVYFKRPPQWREPVYVYFSNPTPPIGEVDWPGVPMEEARLEEGEDWYVQRFFNLTAASFVFTDGQERTPDLYRDRSGWYSTDNTWYDDNPDRAAANRELGQPVAEEAVGTAQVTVAPPPTTEEATFLTESQVVPDQPSTPPPLPPSPNPASTPYRRPPIPPQEIFHALVLEMHQPSGNLERLLDTGEWEAKEILFAYDRMARFLGADAELVRLARVNATFSGILLETLANPDFQRRVYGIVKCGDLLHDWQERQRQGSLEVLGTGYYHPLFALIPEADWDAQIGRGSESAGHFFPHRRPAGFWPPDLAFDMRLIPHLKRAGYRYVIVDDEYVRPLDPMSWHELRYRPHVAEYGGEEIVVVVRDRELSKAQLAGMDYDWFYGELLDRTKHCEFPPLVTTATPGENGGWFRNVDEEANFWGHCYRPALDAVRAGLSLLRPTLINDYLDRFGAHGRVHVERGAWNTEQHHGWDFAQWQGSEAQRRTLQRVRDVSSAFHRIAPSLSPDQREEAYWLLLRAEASDNFFWGDAWLDKVHQDLDAAERIGIRGEGGALATIPGLATEQTQAQLAAPTVVSQPEIERVLYLTADGSRTDEGTRRGTLREVPSAATTALLTYNAVIAEGLSFSSDKCACRECEAAVSPTAYLADLTNYTLNHVGQAVAERVPLYRLRGPAGRGHFYTISPYFRDRLIREEGYRPERTACYVFAEPGDGRIPLYRLFASSNGDHFYTTSADERNNARSNLGYRDDPENGYVDPVNGISCYVPNQPDQDSQPLFQLLLRDGTHFYTALQEERDQAPSIMENEACHVYRSIGRTLTLDALSQIVSQPLANYLPVSCGAVEERVSQVRLCIEVLRNLIARRVLPDADIDCSFLPWPIRFALAGDVDGDGRDEVIIAPQWERVPRLHDTNGGNGFWVMDYDPLSRQWRHLNPILNHRFEADVDPTTAKALARFALCADIDGDSRDELIIAVDVPGSARNDFWVMKYDPDRRRWRHLPGSSGRSDVGSDFACTSTAVGAWYAFAGDVDGDDCDEIIIAPEVGGPSNAFWILKYQEISAGTWDWRHLSPIQDHPLEADLVCLEGRPDAGAINAFAADVDNDRLDEIVVSIDLSPADVTAMKWVMKYDPETSSWRHIRQAALDLQADIEDSGLGVPDGLSFAANSDRNNAQEIVAFPSFEVSPEQFLALNPNHGRVLQWQRDDGRFVAQPEIDFSPDPASTTLLSTVIAADVDGDFRQEIVGLPISDNTPRPGAWVVRRDETEQTWRHLSPIQDHPYAADVSWTDQPSPARTVLAADVDGDHRAELIFVPQGSETNDLWVMDYDPVAQRWSHLGLRQTVERDYAWTAYRALLVGLGTSYEEVIGGRAAGSATCNRLAERLGIETRHLDDLLLAPEAINEGILETRFGLPSTTRDVLAPLAQSEIEKWRLAYLSQQWSVQDWPEDPYYEHRLPVIDPDLIGPDDFRVSLRSELNEAFDVWVRRRELVDHELAKLRSSPNFVAILATMREPTDGTNIIPWPLTTIPDVPDLGGLLAELHQSIVTARDPTTARATIDDLSRRFFLTTDALARLIAIRSAERLWVNDPERVPAVSPEEWREVYDILLQARKLSIYPSWIDEERHRPEPIVLEPIILGRQEFWPSLTEPAEGSWPPVEPLPYIDPDLVSLNDLPTSMIGDEAREIWRRRRTVIDGYRRQLCELMESSANVEAALVLSLSDPPSGQTTWSGEIRRLRTDLIGTDDERIRRAREDIRDELYMRQEDFWRLVAILDRVGRAPITSADIIDLSLILAESQKRRGYSNWATEEQQIPYWMRFKARLPRWRASAQTRTAWTQALRARSQLPIIDPDLIDASLLRTWANINPAARRWRERSEWILGGTSRGLTWLRVGRNPQRPFASFDTMVIGYLFDSRIRYHHSQRLQSIREASGLQTLLAALYGLNGGEWDRLQSDLTSTDLAIAGQAHVRVTEELCLSPQEFAGLMTLRSGGTPPTSWSDIYEMLARAVLMRSLVRLFENMERDPESTARIDQLEMTRGAFIALMRIRGLLARDQAILESDWEVVYAILIQTEKRREAARWRDQERSDGITLSPDCFVLPTSTRSTLPDWRANLTALFDWQDRLQSRIDQQASVRAALHSLIMQVEERTLPMLRDGLIASLPLLQRSPEERAKWITDHLLIDAAESGARRTTRVEQAIESLQTLLWSIRTGQLRDTHPDLWLDAPTFDQDWDWMGSYATWRPAMFVFLYPENLLRPSLRRRRTPAFRQLVDSLRSDRQLTPSRARGYAERYAEYFEDVCSLRLEFPQILEPTSDSRRTVCAQADAPVFQGTGGQAGERHRFSFIFGLTPHNGRVYWCSFDNEADNPQFAQTFWHRLDAFSTPVTEIIGAAVQEQRPDRPDQPRLLFVFAWTVREEQDILTFCRYQIEAGTWDDAAHELDLNFGIQGTITEQVAWLMPTPSEEPPTIGLRFTVLRGDVPENINFRRQINRSGTNWSRLAPMRLSTLGAWSPVTRIIVDRQLALSVSGPLWAGDFDGDGLDELLVGTAFSFLLLDYENGTWTPLSSFNLGGRFAGIWKGDFDGDSKEELLLAADPTLRRDSRYSNFWYRSYQRQSGWTPSGREYNLSLSPDQQFTKVLAVGRFTQQGRSEIVLNVSASPLRWRVLAFDGQNWSDVSSIPNPPFMGLDFLHFVHPITFAVSGDFDGDKLDELAFAREPFSQDRNPNDDMRPASRMNGNLFYVMDFSQGTWAKLGLTENVECVDSFAPEGIDSMTMTPNFHVDSVASFAVSGDFDRDGRDEIAVVAFSANRSGSRVWIADLGDDNRWHVDAPPELFFPNLPPIVSAFVADFDGDHYPELALIFSYSSDGREPQPSTEQERRILIFSYRFSESGNRPTWINAEPLSPMEAQLPADQGSLACVAAGHFYSSEDTAVAYLPGHYEVVNGLKDYYYGLNRMRSADAVYGHFGFGNTNNESVYVQHFQRFFSYRQQCAHSDIIPIFHSPLLSIYMGNVGDRREIYESARLENQLKSPVVQTYLEEAFYFVPMQVAVALREAGQYVAALDWFRTIYDYTQAIDRRKVYYGLIREQTYLDDLHRTEDWLRDPLDPHRIGATRRLAYSRYTLQELVRCFLDYADAEFTRDTGESLARARTLYLTAQELLASPDLQQPADECAELIESIPVDAGGEGFRRAILRLRERLAQVNDLLTLHFLVEAVHQTLVVPWGSLTLDQLANAEAFIEKTLSNRTSPAIADVVGAAPTLMASLPSVLGDEANALIEQAARLSIGPAYYAPGQALAPSFCIPPNPQPRSLRLHANLNLFKLRDGRNIAGMRRELDIYAAPTDTVSGMPSIGPDGQLVVPLPLTLPPTSYRYSVLIARARELVQHAREIEASLLAALEKRDAEAYLLLTARKDIRLARAGISLQELRVREAEGSVRLAELQRDRAEIEGGAYQAWLDAGESQLEMAALGEMQNAIRQQEQAGYFNLAAAGASALAAILPGTAGATERMGSIASGFSSMASYLSGQASQASTRASILSTKASYERRRQEWTLRRDLARQDVVIGSQQIRIAEDHVRVVEQERRIADLQTDLAEQTLEFLAGKFTNVELYDWMSGVLEGVYRFFLQQATGLAQLASRQLGFERQETIPPYIKSDYWVVTSAEETFAGDEGGRIDRRGLTGSARLLQDITQLDQYAFQNNRRKHQLVKTVSLSQVAPVEFYRFRETGVINFNVPLEQFARDFPGHYLRLIRRVRTSVVALIPPTQGIHATLSSTGTSRVEVGGTVFQTIRLRRDPETVALSSAVNATGLFELEPTQPELNLPFEWSGVDVGFELSMPRAANLFDYQSIADVLITIEYTSLDSFDYRQQVLQSMRPALSSDRPFSFRQQFADAWYDLHNPEQTAQVVAVRFRTQREDFSPNLDRLRIQHVALYVSRTAGETFELSIQNLRFSPTDETGTFGGAAETRDGFVSTRRGNAGTWMSLIGKSPIGTWELSLSNPEQAINRFRNNQIDDMLLVITYSGITPAWP